METIKLDYSVIRNRQDYDVRTGRKVGGKYDVHDIVAEVDGQIYRETFIIPEHVKIQTPREESIMFAKKLTELALMIERVETLKRIGKYKDPEIDSF